MTVQTITRGQAMMMLHDHLGEDVYVGLWTGGDGTDATPAGQVEVLSMRGTFAHRQSPDDLVDVSASDAVFRQRARAAWVRGV